MQPHPAQRSRIEVYRFVLLLISNIKPRVTPSNARFFLRVCFLTSKHLKCPTCAGMLWGVPKQPSTVTMMHLGLQAVRELSGSDSCREGRHSGAEGRRGADQAHVRGRECERRQLHIRPLLRQPGEERKAAALRRRLRSSRRGCCTRTWCQRQGQLTYRMPAINATILPSPTARENSSKLYKMQLSINLLQYTELGCRLPTCSISACH